MISGFADGCFVRTLDIVAIAALTRLKGFSGYLSGKEQNSELCIRTTYV